MQTRKFDEMISYFNRKVSDMYIDRKYKMELLAMITAIGMAHEKELDAQHERDIPIKPNETTDKAWGIPKRQAVCPKCDYYLGHVAFLGDYKGKRITYCEVCGQAIDWTGWEFDG